MKSICIFCGSSLGNSPEFREAARRMGALLADRQIQLIYGGANVGLMGCAANACLENGGRVIGVMPENLVQMEVVHDRLTELRVVDSMHQRKAVMSELSDGFIALPGGIGTLEELFEAYTWLQLGIQIKPLGLLNVSGFFDHLKRFLDLMVQQGFLLGPHLDMLLMDPDEKSLLDRLMIHKPRKLDKWFDREKNRA
jgi:uncharacterized protein (TIGR00730 family)